MFVYNVCLCFGMRISRGSLENWGDSCHAMGIVMVTLPICQ